MTDFPIGSCGACGHGRSGPDGTVVCEKYGKAIPAAETAFPGGLNHCRGWIAAETLYARQNPAQAPLCAKCGYGEPARCSEAGPGWFCAAPDVNLIVPTADAPRRACPQFRTPAQTAEDAYRSCRYCAYGHVQGEAFVCAVADEYTPQCNQMLVREAEWACCGRWVRRQ